MRNCRITVMRKAFYKDLAEKYENPIEHALRMTVILQFLISAHLWSRKMVQRKGFEPSND